MPPPLLNPPEPNAASTHDLPAHPPQEGDDDAAFFDRLGVSEEQGRELIRDLKTIINLVFDQYFRDLDDRNRS